MSRVLRERREAYGTCPPDEQHPDFLVLAPGRRNAKQIAENYLISTGTRYWLQVFCAEATMDNVQAILGGNFPVILSGTLRTIKGETEP